MKVITSIDIYLPDGQINREVLGQDDVVYIGYISNDALITIQYNKGKIIEYYGMQCKYICEELPNELVLSYVVAS